ncbi:MAG: MFS transporter [Desulfomonile tiedjei]|nr:MFS transporter [Desulfomonile tiedjei]
MTISFDQKAPPIRWLIFGIMSLAYVGSVFHRICPAVVAVDLQEAFSISGSLLGLLASTYFYSYAIIQLPAGLLSDSLGPRKSASLFLLIGGIGSILFGLAPRLDEALVGRVMVGVGAGMVFTPTMKIISEWFSPREFSRMNAIFVTSGGLGALVAASPLAFLTSLWGWRASFEIIGIATLLLAVLVFLIVRDRPSELATTSTTGGAGIQDASMNPAIEIPLWQGARRVFGEKYFWLVALWAFCTIGIFFSFGGLWAGPYLMNTYGLNRAQTGGILDMLAFGTLFGCLGMSFLSESVLRSRKKVLVMTSAALVAELVFLKFFYQALPIPLLYPLFFLFSLFSVAPAVVSVTVTKELFPVQIIGTSVGMVNGFPFLGGAVFQLVVGRTLDAYGESAPGSYPPDAYSTMFLVLLVPAVVAFVCACLMKETYSRYQTK